MINSKIFNQSIKTKLYFIVFILFVSYAATIIYHTAMDNIVFQHYSNVEESINNLYVNK